MTTTRCAALVILVLFSFAAMPGAADDEATSLLAKHRTFMGWSYGDGTIHSIRYRGRLGGYETTEVRKGATYRSKLIDPKEKLEFNQGFDGKRFWYAGEDGFAVPIVGDTGKRMITETFFDAEAFGSLPATLRGHDKISGLDYGIVRVEPQNGTPMDLWIDPASGKIGRVVFDPDGNRVAENILRYVSVLDGKKIVADVQYGRTKTTYDQIAVNSGIPPEDLQAPVPKAHWTFGSADPIRIDFDRDNTRFHATINGVTGYFLLDTGASGIVVTSGFSNRAHLKTFRNIEMEAVDATSTSGVAQAQTFAVGDNVLHDPYIIVGANAGTFDGIVGFDFLAAAIVTIDFKKSTMRIQDPAKTDLSNHPGLELYVDLLSGTPAIPVTFNGGARHAHVTLDTGDNVAVMVPNSFNDLAVLSTDNRFFVSISGAGSLGGAEVQCAYIKSIEIGPVTYQKPAICYGGESFDGGLLGFDLLRHFNWTLDYPDARWFLEPID